MTPQNKQLFELLKKAVVRQFLVDNYATEDMSVWKGDEIAAFQEDLFAKVKGRVSEKWFYTYMKKSPQKLPRIDMLNLLSQYAGYTGWNGFAASHGGLPTKKTGKAAMMISLVAAIGVFGMGIAVFFILQQNPNTFSFCLVDEEGLSIADRTVDIKILLEDQSPVHLKTDSQGCFQYVTTDNRIRFVMKSPYHKTDTIVRDITTAHQPTVELRTDDYALMLRYYSSGNVDDWNNRRAQLQRLIHDEAEIYQVFGMDKGVALYSKQDFIRKLSIPTSTLKDIRILDKKYRNGKIVTLKFMVE